MKTKKILVNDNGIITEGDLFIDGTKVRFRYLDIDLVEDNIMPFGALREIRKHLDALNVFMLINASRKDVYPSGLIAYSSDAYVHEFGIPVSQTNVVNIFDAVENHDNISTVEEQEKFLMQWVDSLKR